MANRNKIKELLVKKTLKIFDFDKYSGTLLWEIKSITWTNEASGSYLLILLSMSAFSKMSENPNNWNIVTDQVMGGKSELEADFVEGTFQLKGYVTTKNNGGFVRLAHTPVSVDKNTKGIKFMAKGNNETYEIHVTMKGFKMPPWGYHSKSFDVDSEWKEYFIEFKDF